MKFLFTFLLLAFSICEAAPSAIVSVAPHKYFVEKIAGNTLKVLLFVPENATPHGYEPPPKQILEASHADMWFRVGEGFEKKAIEAIKAHQPDLIVVDLRKDLPLIPAPHHHHHGGSCCSADGADLHIWLSLKLAQIESMTITDALIKRFPEHQELYRQNLQKFLGELQSLDQKIQKELLAVKGKTVMVSHPAYAYFCRDYDLKQISIEIDGKEPTPKAMTRTLNEARSLKIRTIFTQPQYSQKGALLIAELLGGKVVELNPYSENYLESIQKIATSFKDGL